MGKVKKEGRLFYKKTEKPSNDAIASSLPSNEAIKTFKFKPVESVPATSSSPNDTPKPSNSKKLKLQQRKEDFIKKISVKQSSIAKKRKVQKNKIKKQKNQIARVAATAIPNLKSLKNALPTLTDNLPSLNSLFMLKTCSELKTGVPKFDKKLVVTDTDSKPKKLTKAMKTRHKKKVFMKRYDYLQKLMADKAFKQNPRKVIADHVRNRRVIEEKFENKKSK